MVSLTVRLKTGEQLTVEADGFTHDGRSVVLTQGEHKVALFPLTSIVGLWRADGTKVLQPPSNQDLIKRLKAAHERLAKHRAASTQE